MSTEPAKEWNTDMLPSFSIVSQTNVLPPPLVRRLVDLESAKAEDENTLLGNRFLCRGGGLLFVGSTGVGKSTGIIQMGISWAVGRTCFGIRPAKPLKILYVQAENDEGDLCEMRDGVLEHLDLKASERDELERNFVCVFESSRTGDELVTGTLQPLLEEHTPDLIILDPALSYLGGDGNEQKIVGPFLRNSLTPMLQKHKCGVLIVHHTNKPTGDQNRKKKVATDFAYAGTGSAEWANWARAVLILHTKDDALRELRIGKRFRLGWKDAEGKPSPFRLLRQNNEGSGLFYTELSIQEMFVSSERATPFDRVLRSSDILPPLGESLQKDALVARITSAKICGRDKALEEILPWLVDRGYLQEKEVPRPRARPAIHYVRTEKKISFEFASLL